MKRSFYWFIAYIGSFVMHRSGDKNGNGGGSADRAKAMIDKAANQSGDNSNLAADEEIIAHLNKFRDLKVSEIMIPRTEIIAVLSSISAEELKKEFIRTKLTRMPIYQKDLDNLIGFIHVKDFLLHSHNNKKFDMQSILRPMLYVPRFTKCIDLLVKMRMNAKHLAVILDEYGGTEGIIMITHLIEGVLGDINDEHDNDTAKKIYIKKLGSDSYIIDGRAQIQDIEKELGKMSNFLYEEDGEYETLSGFILSYIGRMPVKGEKFHHSSGALIEVIEADQRKIIKVKVSLDNAT